MNELNTSESGSARLSASYKQARRYIVRRSGPLAPPSFNVLIAALTIAYRNEHVSFNVSVVG